MTASKMPGLTSAKAVTRAIRRGRKLQNATQQQNNRRKKTSKKSKNKGWQNIFDNVDDSGNIGNDVEIEVKSSFFGSADAFLRYCRQELLLPSTAADKLISQNDASAFITDVCDNVDDEDVPEFHCPSPSFEDLDMQVQLSFAYFVCPDDEAINLVDCLSDLKLKENFGYEINSSGIQSASESAHGFCCSLLPFMSISSLSPLIDDSVCSMSADVEVIVLENIDTSIKNTQTKIVRETAQVTLAPTIYSAPSASPQTVIETEIDAAESESSLSKPPILRSSSAQTEETSIEADVLSAIFVGVSVLVFSAFYVLISKKKRRKSYILDED